MAPDQPAAVLESVDSWDFKSVAVLDRFRKLLYWNCIESPETAAVLGLVKGTAVVLYCTRTCSNSCSDSC